MKHISLVVQLTLVACNATPRSGELEHPIADSLASSQLPSSIVKTIGDRAGSEIAGALKSVLAKATEEISIGELTGPPERVIGEIQDALIAPDSTVYLVDGSYMTVRVYDFRGRSLGSIGGEGGGPGEFFGPRAITITANNVLHITDSNNRIHRFVRSNDSWVFDRYVQLEFTAYDICALGDRLFVAGVRTTGPEVIHEIDDDGAVSKSFGVFYRTDSYSVLDRLVRGARLTCFEEHDLLIAAVPALPETHAYSTDGDIKWVTRIRSWQRPPIVQPRPGATTLSPSGMERLDTIVEIATLPAGYVVVQIESRTVEDLRQRIDRPTSRIYAIDVETGDGGGVDVAFRRLLSSTHTRLLTYSNDPHPQVTLWRH